jgi:hypothetical protein
MTARTLTTHNDESRRRGGQHALTYNADYRASEHFDTDKALWGGLTQNQRARITGKRPLG